MFVGFSEMASSSSLLSEDQFRCPICLDVFTRPVSTPCGHNFCMSCLSNYWDGATVCCCPLCKETFEIRPDLKVNTCISELVEQFMSLQLAVAHTQSSGPQAASSGAAMLCDICTEGQQEAVKSCLECRMSYCAVHLEPHRRAAWLKRHTLVGPVATLEDRICKVHTRLLTLFCKNDKALLCDVCAGSRHTNHNVVPVQQARTEMKALLEEAEAAAQRMIQERLHRVSAIKGLVTQSATESENLMACSVQGLMMLVSELHESQAVLVRVMEEKQKEAEDEAAGFISSMETEVTQLTMTVVKLQELKQTSDQLCFLQTFQNSSLLPPTMDLSTFSFNRHLEVHHLRKSLSQTVSQLQTLLSNMNKEIKEMSDGTNVSRVCALSAMRQHEVSVVLDPTTAHALLVISVDRKQVRYNSCAVLWPNQLPNQNTFTEHLAVIGDRGFSAQKFYFEVFVGQKTEWCLGVATASIQRIGPFLRSPQSGLWAIWFLVDMFETFSCPNVQVYLGKVEKVGVFVDYDGGHISFYDVQNAKLIYSFTDCLFTEELYPYFNPCDNEYGANLEPMIIVPVGRMEGTETQ